MCWCAENVHLGWLLATMKNTIISTAVWGFALYALFISFGNTDRNQTAAWSCCNSSFRSLMELCIVFHSGLMFLYFHQLHYEGLLLFLSLFIHFYCLIWGSVFYICLSSFALWFIFFFKNNQFNWDIHHLVLIFTSFLSSGIEETVSYIYWSLILVLWDFLVFVFVGRLFCPISKFPNNHIETYY